MFLESTEIVLQLYLNPSGSCHHGHTGWEF